MPTQKVKYILCEILVSDSLLGKNSFRSTLFLMDLNF